MDAPMVRRTDAWADLTACTHASEWDRAKTSWIRERLLFPFNLPMWARRADTEEILDILVLLNATTPNCPFRGLDAIAFAVRCERRQHDREAKTRTLEEEAVSDTSPSASKQRGHSSHLPLSSSTDNFALSPLQRVHTLRLQKRKRKTSLFITVFF